MSEQTFTKEQVTQIIRERVNKKNAQIEALELELIILKAGVNNEGKEATTTETE